MVPNSLFERFFYGFCVVCDPKVFPFSLAEKSGPPSLCPPLKLVVPPPIYHYVRMKKERERERVRERESEKEREREGYVALLC
jgi:hypothetical protein